jgi:uncharacterized protein
MLDCLPEQLEPLGLADAGRSFRGTVPIAKLERLAPLLSVTDGELEVQMRLGLDERRIRVLQGTVAGSLDLVCQRCLGALHFPVDLQFRLGIVTAEHEIDELPEGYEPLLVSGDPVRTCDVIEDEVLLALPAIPLHEGAERCETGYTNRPPAEKENPFAVLEKLKS